MGERVRGIGRAAIFVVALRSAAPALAEVEIAARVSIAPSPGDEGGWIEVHLEGERAPALARCQRLVRGVLGPPAASPAQRKTRLVRRCETTPLPPPKRQMLDAQILRVRVSLPTIDEDAIDAPSTTGHVVTYKRLLSAAECERQRGSLAAAQDAKDSKGPLEREARLSQEKISQVCEHSIERPIQRKPSQNAKFLEADRGRSRCQQAKRMGELLAAKRAKAKDEYTCVRTQ